jgi:hypothetical protein
MTRARARPVGKVPKEDGLPESCSEMAAALFTAIMDVSRPKTGATNYKPRTLLPSQCHMIR